MECLVDRALGVKRQLGVNLGRDAAGNDVENLLAKFDQETVKSEVDLGVGIATLLLGVGNGIVNQLSILGLLGSGEDERRVGGGILGLVLVNGCEVVSICFVERVGRWQAVAVSAGVKCLNVGRSEGRKNDRGLLTGKVT